MKQRKDGRWCRSVKIDNKRVFFYSLEKTEKKAAKDIERQMVEYSQKEQKTKLFETVADNWYEEHSEKLSYTTADKYKPHLKFIKEYFSDMYINDITPNDVKHIISRRINMNYSQKTVQHTLSVMKMIFEYACINQLIRDNPCAYIKVPQNLPKTKRLIPTKQDIETIKSSIDKPFGLFAYFLLYTGLRRGEALALTYNDIDFKKKRISINKSVYFQGNKPYLKEPKTQAGKREVILLDCLAAHLPRNKIGLVFTDNGSHLMQHQFFKYWKDYQHITGLDITAHQIRHAYCSYILHDMGVDVKTAQYLMGHADISTTQNIYTQITTDNLRRTEELLNIKLSNAQMTKKRVVI